MGPSSRRLERPLQQRDLYKTIWWFHACWVFLFFAVIPKMRLRHILVAIGAAAGVTDQPMGRLRTISMEEVEQTEQVEPRWAPTSADGSLCRWTRAWSAAAALKSALPGTWASCSTQSRSCRICVPQRSTAWIWLNG